MKETNRIIFIIKKRLTHLLENFFFYFHFVYKTFYFLFFFQNYYLVCKWAENVDNKHNIVICIPWNIVKDCWVIYINNPFAASFYLTDWGRLGKMWKIKVVHKKISVDCLDATVLQSNFIIYLTFMQKFGAIDKRLEIPDMCSLFF
jgi:hypothetical protein